MNVISDPVPHCWVKVAIRLFFQQPPHPAIRLKCDGATLLRLPQQKRKNGVPPNVAGDVFFGVIGSHLFLVDILLKDIAQHIRVNLVVPPQRPILQMPLILLKETKQPLKCLVWNLNVLSMLPLKGMPLKDAAVQIRHFAQSFFCLRTALVERLRKAFKKQGTQETCIKPIRPRLPAFSQVRPEIVDIAVKEAFLLDKVNEHQAIEHDRRIPFPPRRLGNPLYETQKIAMLFLEPLVKLLGHFLHIKGQTNPTRHIYDAQAFLFLLQSEGKPLQLLQQRLAPLPPMIHMRPRPLRPSRLPLDPLPHLRLLIRRNIHNHMLAHPLGHRLFDLLPNGMIREAVLRLSHALINYQTPLLRNRFQ